MDTPLRIPETAVEEDRGTRPSVIPPIAGVSLIYTVNASAPEVVKEASRYTQNDNLAPVMPARLNSGEYIVAL